MADTRPHLARLQPFDGMFLRARHLDLVQSYTRDFAGDTALAGGCGTVFGLALTVDGANLRVGPGLAVTADGEPMALDTDSVTGLPAPPAAPAAWLVGAQPTVVEGDPDELTYSRLPGAAGSAGQGRRSSTSIAKLEVTVTPHALPPVDGLAAEQLRSAIAGAYFAAERPAQQLPDPLGDGVWGATARPVGSAGVPLGLLLHVDGDWAVDLWAVRRDRIEQLPATSWRWSLGTRPQAVALAQMLQFQAQLAAAPTDQLVSTASTDADGAGALARRGFLDLPPGGYLPLGAAAGDPESLPARLPLLFGTGPVCRVLACDEGTARSRVEGVGSLDRIVLQRHGTVAPSAEIDILVPGSWVAPDPGVSGPVRLTPSADWAAYARREVAEPAPDNVDVYAVHTAPADYRAAVLDAEHTAPPADQLVGRISRDDAPGVDLYDKIRQIVDGVEEVTIIPAAPDVDALPRTADRAARLLGALGGIVPAPVMTSPVQLAGLSRPVIRLIAREPEHHE